MIPVSFPEANAVLAANQDEYEPLPVRRFEVGRAVSRPLPEGVREAPPTLANPCAVRLCHECGHDVTHAKKKA